MPTFVSLPNPTRVRLYLKHELSPDIQVNNLRSKFGVQVSTTPEWTGAEVLGGKEAGARKLELAANQRALINLGFFHPYRYQALVAINPVLNETALVQAPLMTEPGEVLRLRLIVTAQAATELAELPWLARIYLFE